jgi:teichuronic acid biosynthesis glycosyltransferase TuaG
LSYSHEVSIITPIYNGEKYLNDISNCILGQTFIDFEWILIDDCSTDNTREKLRELSLKDTRVKPVLLEKNSGPIVARNMGMEIAKGRFIAFIDADDLWTKEKLEKQIAFMKEHDIALSYTAFKKINDNGDIISRFKVPVPKRITYNKLIESNSIPASSAMFDRSKTGDIRQDTEAPVSKDDFFFWLKILEKCTVGMGMKEDLFRLRIHQGSITSDKWEMAKRHWRMYRDIFGFSVLKSSRYYIIYSIKGLAKYIL